MTNIFTAIGIASTFVIYIVLLLLLIDHIYYSIHEAMWVHKYKHRFDKPPTAACYCIDCKYHGDATDLTRCTYRKGVVLHTADEWFCQAAEPKERGE